MNNRFEVTPQVHARHFQDEVVVLDLGAGKYFSLDAVGSTVWEQLTLGKTVEEAAEAVVAEYEVDLPTAMADVARLVSELVGAGLLATRP